MKNRKGGPKCSTSIGKLIQRNDYTMQDIADKIGVHVSTVKNYVRGKTRVTNNVIIDVAEILNNDPENIERLFDEAYDQYHINPKQITIDDIPSYLNKCNDQLKDGCPFKDKLNEYFGKYRIGLCTSRDNYTKEEFDIRYDTLMDLEKCVANAYIDLIYKGSTPDFVSIWKDTLDKD